MRRLAPANALCLLPAACQTTAERQARLDAQDKETCLSYGAKRGSDACVKCGADLQRNRAIDRVANSIAFENIGGFYPGPFFCRGGFYGAGCF